MIKLVYMSADLHIHSSFSDGTETPTQIVQKSKAAGLEIISITDHDTIAGIPEAFAAAQGTGVEVIPAVELSTELDKSELHIIGYFIDQKNGELLSLLKKRQNGRRERIYKIFNLLKNIGIEIDPKEAFDLAGHESAGRPHVARVLIKNGIAANIKDAFRNYLTPGKPAYVPHFVLHPKEAIETIKKSGGCSVLAHPAVSNRDDLIPELIGYGLCGIEVYYTSHREEQIKHYIQVAKKYGLHITGGSDYHGENSGREIKLGDFKFDKALVEELKK